MCTPETEQSLMLGTFWSRVEVINKLITLKTVVDMKPCPCHLYSHAAETTASSRALRTIHTSSAADAGCGDVSLVNMLKKP